MSSSSDRTTELDSFRFPTWLLNAGFLVALGLGIGCLVLGATYLFLFEADTRNAVLPVIRGDKNLPSGGLQLAITGQMYVARITLLSCGVFVGMAFGFIGFALFLLGVKGDVRAEGSYTTLKIKLERLSPGVFVILCSTILTGICATRSLPFNYSQRTPSSYTFSDKDLSAIDTVDSENDTTTNTNKEQSNSNQRQTNGPDNSNKSQGPKGRADQRNDPNMP